MYIDSSIRFQNQNLNPSIATAKTSGIALQTLTYFNLTCYTNPRMFHWFKETEADYESFPTLEANIIMLHKSFVTSLIMKAWVTCAMDKNCIAPEGSRLGNCCGCHRFDQDAITIVTTFFYGYPKLKDDYFAANSFLNCKQNFCEQDFFKVMRGDELENAYFHNYLLNNLLVFLLIICILLNFLFIFKLASEKTMNVRNNPRNFLSEFKLFFSQQI